MAGNNSNTLVDEKLAVSLFLDSLLREPEVETETVEATPEIKTTTETEVKQPEVKVEPEIKLKQPDVEDVVKVEPEIKLDTEVKSEPVAAVEDDNAAIIPEKPYASPSSSSPLSCSTTLSPSVSTPFPGVESTSFSLCAVTSA